MEIARHQPMRGKVLPQHIKELHQSRRDILCGLEIILKRQLLLQSPGQLLLLQRMLVRMIRGAARFIPHTQKPCRHRIELRAIEFEKVALGIDQDVGLQGSLGGRVVADEVVGEIVPDFEGEEEARARHVRVPVEDGLVDDSDFVGVALG